MGMPDEPYYTIIVETYRISGSGLHGDIHVRPGARTNEPAKIPHSARSSSDSRSTAKQDKVCDRDSRIYRKGRRTGGLQFDGDGTQQLRPNDSDEGMGRAVGRTRQPTKF